MATNRIGATNAAEPVSSNAEMKHPFVKTKVAPPRFGVLKYPDFDMQDDAGMYDAVRNCGRAVIFVLSPSGGKEGEITVAPEDFEKEWIGD